MMLKIHYLEDFERRKKLKPLKCVVFRDKFPLHFQIPQKTPFTCL